MFLKKHISFRIEKIIRNYQTGTSSFSSESSETGIKASCYAIEQNVSNTTIKSRDEGLDEGLL